MNTFKLRAEVITDIVEFLCKIEPVEFVELKVKQLPDSEFSFRTEMSRNDLLEILTTIEDGHVMIETLELESDYTGDRNFDLEY